MSQDQDPIDATRSFEPVDPYNIPPEQAGAAMPGYEGYGYQQGPGYEQPQEASAAPQQSRAQGVKQRLTRLGPLKLAVLGTAGVIVLGGAAMGTAAAFQSGSSSSNTAATAPATDQSQAQSPAAGGATSGGTGKHKAGKAVRLKVTEAQAGTIWGTDAKGKQVTVTYGDSTKFGTKKMPLDPANITPGESIDVVGAREGDKITATSILFFNPKLPKGPGAPGTATPPRASTSPTDPASPVGGDA
jgi:hypothetical protein